MEINASMVKKLRELSGAGFMDCKKALIKSEGNIDIAIDFLRKTGIMKAEKISNKIAAEGIIKILIKDNVGVIVEVNSETDFVAKNEVFRDFCFQIANQIMLSSNNDVDKFLEEDWYLNKQKSVKEVLDEKKFVIGENLRIRRFKKISSNGIILSYVHGDGRIGVLVDVNVDKNKINDKINGLIKDISMQIAAMNPKYLSREDVSEDYLEKERNILLEQIKNEERNKNKPEEILKKMIIGKLNKKLKEVCLLDQAYIKDQNITVNEYINTIMKEEGIDISINSFVRFETGEGLEKKENNFAEEVASQIK